MHIAYSALNNNKSNSPENSDDPITRLRYQAYQQACKKHRNTSPKYKNTCPAGTQHLITNTKYKAL